MSGWNAGAARRVAAKDMNMQRTRRNPDGGEHPSMTYQRIEREAREARDRAVSGLTGAERKAALRTARAEYDRVVNAAWDAYQRVIGNRRNPVKAFLGYTGDDLHGHAIPWSREGHARIRAAIGRIDRARTHAEMFKAYSDALKVRYALEAKGLGSGRGYPVEWGNDIGSSYWAKYKELGPTEEDKIAAAYKAAQAAEKERARAKRKRNSGDDSISVGERVRVLTGDYYDQRSKKQIHHDGLYVVGVVASVTKGGQYNVDLLNGHQLRARASAVSRTTRELTPAKPVHKSGLFR